MNFIKNEIKKYGLTVACLGWLSISVGAFFCHIALMHFLKLLLSMGV
jgi:hypothetical protein